MSAPRRRRVRADGGPARTQARGRSIQILQSPNETVHRCKIGEESGGLQPGGFAALRRAPRETRPKGYGTARTCGSQASWGRRRTPPIRLDLRLRGEDVPWKALSAKLERSHRGLTVQNSRELLELRARHRCRFFPRQGVVSGAARITRKAASSPTSRPSAPSRASATFSPGAPASGRRRY